MTKTHKVIIIGSGPAGYSAAVYASRALLEPLLFEGSEYAGGQLTTTSNVENYLGFESINGLSLTEKFKDHATNCGTMVISKNITSVNFDTFPYIVIDEDNIEYETFSVIIATGASAKILDIEGGNKFWHYGISACAVCDGALPMFRGKSLAVVGGGDSAFEEALFLSKYGSEVYLIHRRDTFRASKIMIERASKNPKIKFVLDSIVTEAKGTDKLESIDILNIKTNEATNLTVNGLFYGIGHVPNTSFIKDSGISLDEDGYIITNDTKTNIKGIFACGDVQDKKYRQAITSAGTGCMAALEVEKYLETIDVSNFNK